MKKYFFLIIVALILGLVLTGCSLLSNISQVPATGQSGIAYLTKALPQNDLVGLWRFNGDVTDSSSNNNDGTVSGGESYVDSPMGKALIFDGVGDYVQLPASNTIMNTDTFTIEAWFKTSVNHSAYGEGTMEGRIVNLARDAAGFTAVALYVEENNIAVCYRNATEFKHLKYAVNYYDDVWHHIAVTRDATTYRLYYDGSPVASRTDTFYGFGTSAAYLGTFNSSERFFNGLIDEARIWNTALTADQLIRYGFNGLMAPYATPEEKTFKAGRTIPLKWQYTDFDGNVVDSFDAYPVVEFQFAGTENGGGDLELTEYPGLSGGLHYDSTPGIWQWQFNWQTKEVDPGKYNIWITSEQTGQVNGPFLIELR